MGVWDGDWVVVEETADLPPLGDIWQVISTPDEPIVSRIGTSTGSNFYCDPAPYQRPVIDFEGDWPWLAALAVQADWPLVPHKVEDFTSQQAVYIDAVIEVLAGRGLVVDTAHIEQLIRLDLEGDGVDEVIVVATEGERDNIYSPATDAPFEIVMIRKVIEGEVWTAVLDVRLPDQTLPDPDFPFPFLFEFEVIAAADLNGDGKMEFAIRESYYEGTALVIWEYLNADIGYLPVLGIGCGA